MGKLVGRPADTSIHSAFGIFYSAFENVTAYNESGMLRSDSSRVVRPRHSLAHRSLTGPPAMTKAKDSPLNLLDRLRRAILITPSTGHSSCPSQAPLDFGLIIAYRIRCNTTYRFSASLGRIALHRPLMLEHWAVDFSAMMRRTRAILLFASASARLVKWLQIVVRPHIIVRYCIESWVC